MFRKRTASELRTAAVEGKLDFFKLFLGANPPAVGRWNDSDGTVDEHGWNALHFAAANGQARVVELLCKVGFNPDRKTNNQWTALHLAAYNNHTMVADVLLRCGSRTTLVDDDGSTAMELAEMVGNREVVKLLYAREQKERKEGEERAKKHITREAIHEEAEKISKEDAQKAQSRMLAAIEAQFEQRQKMVTIEHARRVKIAISEWQTREAAERLAIKSAALTVASDTVRAFEQDFNELAELALSARMAPASPRGRRRNGPASPRASPRGRQASGARRFGSLRSLQSGSMSAGGGRGRASGYDTDDAGSMAGSVSIPNIRKKKKGRTASPRSPRGKRASRAGSRASRASSTSSTQSKRSAKRSLRRSKGNKRDLRIDAVFEDGDALNISGFGSICFANRSAVMADEALEEEQANRLKAWCVTAPFTHPGEFTFQGDDTTKSWTCCGSRTAYGTGCTQAMNPVKGAYHPGEFQLHLDDCRCSNPRRNLKKAGSFLAKPGGPLSPRTLHRYRQQGISMFCSPGMSCWDCCGAHLHGAPGCRQYPVYQLVAPKLTQPDFGADAPNRRIDALQRRGQLVVGEEGTSVETFAVGMAQYTTLLASPNLDLRQGKRAWVHEVSVEACGSAVSGAHISVGLVGPAWGGDDATFLGDLHSIGWWSNSSTVVGCGKREHTAVKYSQGDVVSILVDGVNKEVAFFTSRGNQTAKRTLAVLLTLPAMPDALRPAVCLHSGCKVSFLTGMHPGLPPAQKAVVRERVKFFADWVAKRHRREEEERLEHIISHNTQPELLPYINSFQS
eukprot:TRINITY_DN12763_c0_g1_i1.p1 TRINITY_DN12763_c0_g1~~TRINITY_DN12763_c0_g1_i1.p1  ORF type:complete len:793 (+),score=252.48 TRINITY_DN12763_c0_g1_i1:137-2515(+)